MNTLLITLVNVTHFDFSNSIILYNIFDKFHNLTKIQLGPRYEGQLDIC